MSPRSRNAMLVVASVVVAFGAGAGWQFTQARQARTDLTATGARLESVTRDLQFQQLESELALAAVAAQLGNFERSRQLSSDFFTSLQERLDAVPEAERPSMAEILAARDATITSLSRSEPGAALELARLLARFRDAMGRDSRALAPSTPHDSTH